MSEFVKNKAGFLLVMLAAVIATVTVVVENGGLLQVNTDMYKLGTVIIDAGHGYPDNGAQGVSGTKEKDLNLEVAKRLGECFTKGGYNVVYTRTDDMGLHDEGVSNVKRSDLNNRVRMMSETGADLFISVHMNKFGESKYHGAQVFYSKNDPMSRQVAQSIQRELVTELDTTNTRECKETYDSIFVLKNATIPAVLVECGFLSNPEEEAKLKTPEYQQNLALTIYNGTVKAYGVTEDKE